MTSRSEIPDYVVIDGVAYPKAGTFVTGGETEQFPAQNFQSENFPAQKPARFPQAAHTAILGRGDSVPSYDPHSIHREFPDRWQAYIRANYRNLNHVSQVFSVSERTARSWWKGETGANGGHVAIAVNEHPVAAPRMLFAAG